MDNLNLKALARSIVGYEFFELSGAPRKVLDNVAEMINDKKSRIENVDDQDLKNAIEEVIAERVQSELSIKCLTCKLDKFSKCFETEIFLIIRLKKYGVTVDGMTKRVKLEAGGTMLPLPQDRLHSPYN